MHKLITRDIFIANCKKYYQQEKRASFYDFATEIVKVYPVHAAVIIIATWNTSRFSKVKRKGEFLSQFKTAFKQAQPSFKKLEGINVKNADFNKLKIPNHEWWGFTGMFLA